MASATFNARVIVLRKTKLGESDLIVTLLAEDGSQLRAVAKGARKPSSTFAARLELYAVADVLCSKGRSLDIIKEARLVEGNANLRCTMEHAACAAPMAELLDRVTQMGLEIPKLFALTQAALHKLNDAPASLAPALCAAHLLKTLAFSGLRPSLTMCVCCGTPVSLNVPDALIPVSYCDGGVVCANCHATCDTLMVPASTLSWCTLLLGSTFQEIGEASIPLEASFAALRFCQQWIREHVSVNLKSLNFLFTAGLF